MGNCDRNYRYCTGILFVLQIKKELYPKKQIKFFPDVYKDRIGKSYNDYIAGHQMNLFEDFIGYQGSVVLDEPEQKTDTISVPIPQCEESENIPLSDFPEQPENVQRPGSEVIEKGMLT